jgi:hypothetical protein
MNILKGACLQFSYNYLTKISLSVFLLSMAIATTVIAQRPIRKTKPLSPRRISFAEAQRILANESEGNLTNQLNKFSRTKLGDGQVLEVYYPIVTRGRTARSKPITVAGYGILYESETVFKDATRPRHMLEDLIPDGRDLIIDLPQLVARLEKRLRVGAGKLDFSRASLRRLDAYIAGFHSSHTTAQTNPKLFQELTAYYGETLRRALNGEWKVREERVGDTHIQNEPNIAFDSGGRNKEIKPWSSVISALYDEDKRGIGLTKVFDADVKAAK